MEFLKKHYEKIVLSAVILGLVAAALWLSVSVSQAREKSTVPDADLVSHKPYVATDLGDARNAMVALSKPPGIILSGEHNLFNPVTWKSRKDGTWFKVLKEGADALTVTNISPLYFIVNYYRMAGQVVTLDVQTNSGRKMQVFATVNQTIKGQPFVVRGIKGADSENPEVDLEMLDTHEMVSVTSSNAYKRVDGHEADMTYQPDSLTLSRKKLNDTLTLSGEKYKIIAITNNAVTVQSTRTTQKTVIEWAGAH